MYTASRIDIHSQNKIQDNDDPLTDGEVRDHTDIRKKCEKHDFKLRKKLSPVLVGRCGGKR